MLFFHIFFDIFNNFEINYKIKFCLGKGEVWNFNKYFISCDGCDVRQNRQTAEPKMTQITNETNT